MKSVARRIAHPAGEAGRAVAALAALAQETRLAIFRLLVEHARDGLTPGAIAARLDLAPATLSFHLKELASAGLIADRREGRFIWYRPDITAMNRLLAYLTENCCRSRQPGRMRADLRSRRMRSTHEAQQDQIMKRFHVHLGVPDLGASIRFYSALFGMAPTVEKPDYAKWMLDDPRVNFAISQRAARAGLNHLGVQVDSAADLAGLRERFVAADDAAVTDEPNANCCYARSDKHWVRDPQGIPWEAFHSLGTVEIYGDDAADSPDMTTAGIAPAKTAAPAACCAPVAASAPRGPACCS